MSAVGNWAPKDELGLLMPGDFGIPFVVWLSFTSVMNVQFPLSCAVTQLSKKQGPDDSDRARFESR